MNKAPMPALDAPWYGYSLAKTTHAHIRVNQLAAPAAHHRTNGPTDYTTTLDSAGPAGRLPTRRPDIMPRSGTSITTTAEFGSIHCSLKGLSHGRRSTFA
jgi:hypothetical protein